MLEFQQGGSKIILFFLMEIICPDISLSIYFCRKLFLKKGLGSWVIDAWKPQGRRSSCKMGKVTSFFGWQSFQPREKAYGQGQMMPSFVAQQQFIFYLNYSVFLRMTFINVCFPLNDWELQENRDSILSLFKLPSSKPSAWHTVGGQQICEWVNEGL